MCLEAAFVYSEWLVLAALFGLAFLNISIVNAGYLLFLILFIVSPTARLKLWSIMVREQRALPVCV